MIKVTTIAGSDASGGAGLEADLKTFEEYGVYGMAAVTLVATMNPDNEWSHNVFPLDEMALRSQLETVFKGVGVNSAKSGMLGSFFAVELVREYITNYNIKNYVLDPVMVCKGSGEPLHSELNDALAKNLLPLAAIVTPNIFEAEQLSGIKNIDSIKKIEEAARIIHSKGARSVFIKGPRLPGASRAVDVFFDGSGFIQIEDELIKTSWTHGAGCTLSAAITAALARGATMPEAVKSAKKFITSSLKNGFALNKWVGPGNPCAWRSNIVFNS
ncbi:MAG: bifunctional hydroxymethylpyrimidine kinase/phosphomethylpyrimidine kinase [Spirochaetaceae bacterium]|nr:bifunctional hydroxymethylpyrimidine kinase/phosphomethylpyrimidine kinase [Spirochaetaceae bacterium]